MSIRLLLLACLLSPPASLAEGHPACAEGLKSERSAAAVEMRDIAASCPPGATADLWYNRAYHADLLDRYQRLMQLEAYRAQDDARNYHSYRIFIGLSEALARYGQQAQGGDAVVWLNSIYDRAGEIAEMRLKGYDLQADRLEAGLWAK